MTPQQFAAYVRSEYDRYGKLLPELGLGKKSISTFTCSNEEVFKASTNKTVFTGFGASPAPRRRGPGAQQFMQRMMRSEDSRSRTWTRAAST